MRTMSAAEVRRALAATERSPSSRSGLGVWAKRGAITATLLGFLTLITGWALGWFSTPAQVLEVRAAINEQIAELDKVSKGQAPYGGGPNMGKVSASMRNLPEEMRRQVRSDFGRLMEAGENAQVNSFFLMSPAQREAELDRRIKAEQEGRKAFLEAQKKRAAERSKGGGRGGNAGGQGEGRPGTGQTAATNQGGGGGGGGRGQGGRGGSVRGGSSEEDRNNRRKSFLDNTDPGQRSRRTEYRRQLDERRKQLGGGR
jgi:hypothetical protein